MGNLYHITGNVGVGPVLLANPSCTLDIIGYAGTTYPILLESTTDTCLLNLPIGTVIVVDATEGIGGAVYSGGAASPARLANFPNSSNKIVRYTSNNNCSYLLTSNSLGDQNGKVQGTWQLIGGMKFTFAGDGFIDPYAWHLLVCQRIS